MKIEINEKGTITGRYPGNQLATIDNTSNQDGTSIRLLDYRKWAIYT
jgi:hypothetical protein